VEQASACWIWLEQDRLQQAKTHRLKPVPPVRVSEQLGSGRNGMKNLNFLAAAYIAIWLVFCGYVLSVARRMANLKDDIRRLKQDGK